MDNYRDTVLSQYKNSPILGALLDNMNTYLDPTLDFDNFFSLVMNLPTATGYGLDLWGRIVGVTRVVQVPIYPLHFGFAEMGRLIIGFEETGATGFFYDGTSAITQPFSLNDTDFLTLIYAKGLYNITDGSIPAINQILLNLFPGRGNCFVEDNGGMTMTYNFTFALTDAEYAIVTQSDVLPRPVGVSAQVVTA